METYITYKVTNANLFNKVEDINFDLKSYSGTHYHSYRDAYFQGDVSIEIHGVRSTISGQHAADDYEDAYGFQIVKEYVREDAEDKHWNDVSTWNERHSYDD